MKHSEALLHELADLSDEALKLELAHYLDEMEETAEPSWIDMAVMRITDAGLPMPPRLQVLAARVAKLRLLGGDEKQRRRVAPAMAKVSMDMALRTMATLIGLGMHPRDAAKQTSEALFSVHGWAYADSYIRRKYNAFRMTSECQLLVEWGQHNGRSEGFKELVLERLRAAPRRAAGSYN